MQTFKSVLAFLHYLAPSSVTIHRMSTLEDEIRKQLNDARD